MDVYTHATRTTTTRAWGMARLLAELAYCGPRGRSTPHRTLCVGSGQRFIAISTDGPGRYTGQHGVQDAEGAFLGAMLYFGLSTAEVRRALIALYSGRAAERCFSGHPGEFRPYTPGAGQASVGTR